MAHDDRMHDDRPDGDMTDDDMMHNDMLERIGGSRGKERLRTPEAGSEFK